VRTEDIGYLLAVADAGSLVAAARGLGVSQPTLSKSIARLERALGTPLIARLPRGVALTDAGRAFVDRARPVDRALAEAVALARAPGRHSADCVRIGIGVGVPPALVRAACAAVLRDDPVSIELVGGMSDTLAASVAAGETDFAVTNEPSGARRLKWERLFSDPMIPVVGIRHPLARLRRIDWPTLAGQLWIAPATGTAVRGWFEAQFALRGLPPPERIVSVRDYFASPEFAATLGAIALMPASYLCTDGDPRRYRGLALPEDWRSDRWVGLLHRADGRQGHAAANLMKAFDATARALFQDQTAASTASGREAMT
jgi:DNA-binding transcriptional LysR family regulator